MKEILQSEDTYQNLRGQFFKLLDMSFNNTFKYLERFEDMRLQYKEDLTIDRDELKQCRGMMEKFRNFGLNVSIFFSI